MKNTLALVLMVIGLVGCATTPTYDSESYENENGAYIGEWKNGKWNGQGTFTYDDGVKYVGEFKDYYFHGQGSFTNPNDGSYYIGQWKYGEFHGEGTFKTSGGRKYVGSFRDGELSGQGTLTYSNGDKYVGGFKDSVKHGTGTIVYANGDSYTANFINDKLIDDTLGDSNQQDGKTAIDLIKSAGELVLGGLYIAIAVAGSPEALEYQESKNQKAREEAAYIRGKKECQQTKKC